METTIDMEETQMAETKLYPLWEELLKATCDLPYDSFISHQEIQDIINVKKDTPKWCSVLSAWKKHLLEDHLKCIDSVRGEGYRIVKPSEHIGMGKKQLKKAQRAAKRGLKTVVCTDHTHLNDAQRSENLHAQARMGAVVAITDDESVKLSMKMTPEMKKFLGDGKK